MSSELLQAALDYAAKGIPVFPLHSIAEGGVCSCMKPDCGSPGKHPSTRNGLLDATTDPQIIRRWWTRDPESNIGMVTGEQSGLVVVDIDPRHGGVRTWADLIKGHEFIQTREVQTGGGGNHLFFRTDKPVKNSQGDHGGLGPGVDVRGVGGYVVAPPSNHISGGVYRWDDESAGISSAPLPDWLYELMTTPAITRNGNTHGNKLLDVPATMAGVKEGGRDWALFQLASKFRRAGLSLDMAERLILEAAANCVPPFPPEDARKKVISAYGRYQSATVDDAGDGLEQLSANHFRITTTTPSGFVVLDFLEMERERREIATELHVRLPDHEPYRQRINLLSMSAREQLRRDLDAVFGKDAEWAKVLARGFSKAQQAFEQVDRAIPILDIDSPPTMQWAIDQFSPASGPTILFGAGGANKTYLAIAAAVSLATGSSWVGRTVEPRNVLYVDYETGPTMASFRTKRVLAGLDRARGGTDLPIFYWQAKGVPLPDQLPALRQAISRHGIGYLLVDHIAACCGGRPEDAEVAIRVEHALEELGLPSLLIAHITAEGERDPNQVRKPFGSTFWLGMSRASWFVQRASKEGDRDNALIGFYNKKDSDVGEPDDFAIKMHFEPDGGPVSFAPGDIMESSLLNATRGPVWAIFEALTEPMTVMQISEVANIKPTAVKNYLNRDGGKRFKRVASGGGKGKQTFWSRAEGEQADIPFD